MARLLSQVQAPERRYVHDLRSVFRSFHSKVTEGLDLARIASREDAKTIVHVQLDEKAKGLIPALRRASIPIFDRMAKGIKESNARGQRLMGVSYTDVGVMPLVATFREKNLQLIENAAGDFMDQLSEVLSDPEVHGLRVEEIAARIQERSDVSESRAELIARDQTLRLNRQVTGARQQSAGVSSFQWSTSQDERVRDTHAALEGRVFPWSSPPVEFNDIQCRCVQLPMLPDSEESDDV